MQVIPQLAITPMNLDDIAAVRVIERQVFPTPWPRNAYSTELSQNRNASYVVLRRDQEVIGYAGVWQVGSECHVTTIGVRAADQGRGYGKALFIALLTRAYAMRAQWMTLEVRAANTGAILLYESFGFKTIGRRRGYYTDDGEDALVMWSDSLHAPRFKSLLRTRADGVGVDGLGVLPQ